MICKGYALLLMTLTLLLTASDLNAQQFSSSPELEVLPGEIGYDTIDVAGIGSYINFTFGLIEACVTLEIVDAAACEMIANQVFLELHTPNN